MTRGAVHCLVACATICVAFASGAEPLSRPDKALPLTPDPSTDPAIARDIASVSKPITAVAITKLIQERKLGLDDRYVDVLDLDSIDIVDERIRDVTVRNLLNHTGGWDRAISSDPTGNRNRNRIVDFIHTRS